MELSEYLIYGKSPDSRRFMMMNVKEGYCVNKLKYATIFKTEEEAKDLRNKLAKQNLYWEFEVRKNG